MTGKGKNGKFAKNQGARRHDKKKENVEGRTGLTLGAVRRLARRGGIKRISAGIYDETKAFVDYFLELVVKDAVIFAHNARKKTITAMHIILALKRRGRTLYGYGV